MDAALPWRMHRWIQVGAILGLVLVQACQLESDELTPEDSELELTVTAFDDALPVGIGATATTKSACFLPGEIDTFDVQNRANAMVLPSCSQTFLRPTTSIVANTYYTNDSGGSLYDCVRVRRNEWGVRPINNALEQINKFADARLPMSIVNPNRAADARCLAEVFAEWAMAAGLTTLGTTDAQARFVQGWVAGGLASVYAKYNQIDAAARTLPFQSTTQSQLIKRWFGSLATKVYQQITDIEARVAANPAAYNDRVNMHFWRGYSLLALSLHSENQLYIAKSRAIFDKALGEVTASGTPDSKGFLPNELLRRARALSYHAFALQPLMGMVALSRAMSCDFIRLDQHQWAIALLFRKIIEGNFNPRTFQDAVYAHVNGGLPDSVISYASAEQTSTGSVDHLFTLLGDSPSRPFIARTIDQYLAVRGMVRSTTATAPVQYLGGRLDHFPAAGTYPPTTPELRSFCASP